jgi:hypothetical protein
MRVDKSRRVRWAIRLERGHIRNAYKMSVRKLERKRPIRKHGGKSEDPETNLKINRV